MAILFDWIRQIVLFVFIGTILEMLLPNNAMKKYVHFVFGIIFLLLLAKPIFYVFQINVLEQMERAERVLFLNERETFSLQSSIENKKVEIEEAQAAYIWNELKNEMIAQANPIIQEQFNMEISTLHFVNEHFNIEEQLQINTIDVYVRTIDSLNEQTGQVITIDPIHIKPIEMKKKENTSSSNEKLAKTLHDLWQLTEEQKINIIREGNFD